MMEIRATRQPAWWGDGVEIRILDRERREYVKTVTVETTQDNDCPEIPVAVRLRPDQAQMLMDNLWECGLRPTEGTGSAGALSATQRHLDDMKKVAFHALKIQ